MKELFKALADFQQEVPAIHKNTKGYGYSYANLSEIFETINPIMKKHGLGFTQLIQGDYINTKIFFTKTGDYIESNIDVPQGVSLKGMNEFQVMGSAITYLRRYALSAALGLVTDVDNDANGAKEKPSIQAKAVASSGIPKAETRKPQPKAVTASQPKAKASTPTKFKIEAVGDKYWDNAKQGLLKGASLKNLKDTFDWKEGLFEEFKSKMGVA